MDISMNISAALTQDANNAIGLAVLKKAMNVEAQGVVALINAIPQPSAANMPPNLGQNINVAA